MPTDTLLIRYHDSLLILSLGHGYYWQMLIGIKQCRWERMDNNVRVTKENGVKKPGKRLGRVTSAYVQGRFNSFSHIQDNMNVGNFVVDV